MRKIIPAILTNSQADLKNKLKKIKGLADWIQIDIMDGKFVKNTSLTLADFKKIKIPFNYSVHLMVFNPQSYFKDCQELKAKRVVFHLEATRNPQKVLKEMRKYNFEKGLALNPRTPVEKIKPYINYLNLVLLLGVDPGFQGQKLQPVVFKKIKNLKKLSRKIKIGVDGGIKLSNIQKVAKAGSDYLVVGSGLFQGKDVKKRFKLLKDRLK